MFTRCDFQAAAARYVPTLTMIPVTTFQKLYPKTQKFSKKLKKKTKNCQKMLNKFSLSRSIVRVTYL